jgi:hypothetical protein
MGILEEIRSYNNGNADADTETPALPKGHRIHLDAIYIHPAMDGDGRLSDSLV